jgi:predicted ATP-grasp superfamily ATP-dependent carboligase
MDCLAIQQVDDGDDLKGHITLAAESARTILVHEWVTGGGLSGAELPASWAAEGRAMRRAIAADFACLVGGQIRVIVTSDSRLYDDPGPWSIATGDDPARVRELASAADFTVLIAPETSGILAGLTRDLEQAGARLLGSTAGAVELAGDKARMSARLQELSIDTPATRTIVPAAGLPPDARYPAVLKPIDGAGSMHTFYLSDATSLPDGARDLPIALLQPFIPGTPMSASFFVGAEGDIWLIGIGIQRIAIREGRFEYRGGKLPVPCREALPQLVPAVQAIAGLCGFVGVDFIWNAQEARATILEVNPRPTTSYVGLCRLVPPGRLSRSWLAACDPAARDRDALTSLADCIHGKKAFLSFTASGEVTDEDGGICV